MTTFRYDEESKKQNAHFSYYIHVVNVLIGIKDRDMFFYSLID